MDSITGTQWLLIALMGLLAWGFGYVFEVPLASFVGFFVTIVAVVAFFFGGHRQQRRR